MPSFEDPAADAAELSQAARGLAYATRHFDDPADSYAVLGELQSALINLQQSIRQVATLHATLADRASTDAGNRSEGRDRALIAATRLQAAAACVDQATDQLMIGYAESGQVAWLPAASTVEKALADRAADLETEPGRTPSDPRSGVAPGR